VPENCGVCSTEHLSPPSVGPTHYQGLGQLELNGIIDFKV
jgi:hypothetical protein